MGRKSSAKADRRAAVAGAPASPLHATPGARGDARQRVVLDEIARLDALYRDTRAGLDTAVVRARELKVSWTVIGATLGVSRQAARRRFGRVTD
jgi:hypothetical protein